MKSGDRPLVTMSMMTYNQEKYVRESVRGMLAQTYEPLEIVISDDCSMDRTWDIILEEVGSYKENGGRHNIILNRNETNLGIALHYQKVQTFKHGDIFVGNGGDDISYPNRVNSIVEIFLEAEEDVLVVYTNARTIDPDGNPIGELPERYFHDGHLGAVAAYSRRLRDEFPPITQKGAHEDVIMNRRCKLLGGVAKYVRDKLMDYRIGCGVSTVLNNWRRPNLNTFKAMAPTAHQSLVDAEYVKDKLSDAAYCSFCNEMTKVIDESKWHIELLAGDTFSGRWTAYKHIHYKPWFRPGGVFQLVCLLPARIGDPILNLLARISFFIEGF